MSVELPNGMLLLRIDLLSHVDLPSIKLLPETTIKKVSKEYVVVETDSKNIASLEALHSVILITLLNKNIPDTDENIVRGPAILY